MTSTNEQAFEGSFHQDEIERFRDLLDRRVQSIEQLEQGDHIFIVDKGHIKERIYLGYECIRDSDFGCALYLRKATDRTGKMVRCFEKEVGIRTQQEIPEAIFHDLENAKAYASHPIYLQKYEP